MAKNEDMSNMNYAKLKAADNKEEINWATIYLENLRRRAVTLAKKGGTTMVHAHLRALARAAQDDPEAKKRRKFKDPKEKLKQTSGAPGTSSKDKKREAPTTLKELAPQGEKDPSTSTRRGQGF